MLTHYLNVIETENTLLFVVGVSLDFC